MKADIVVLLMKDHRRNKRYIYCEAHTENGHALVEKLEVPRDMPGDVAIHYARQLFENTLRKKGYEIAESEQ